MFAPRGNRTSEIIHSQFTNNLDDLLSGGTFYNESFDISSENKSSNTEKNMIERFTPRMGIWFIMWLIPLVCLQRL